ncbi:MAG: helix-hairpin-helix domain-containing protein, partial [Cyanobacteria bacterium P01_F01_bin.143]
SKEDFMKVTGVSRKWLDSISPYFKFPEWVNNTNNKTEVSNFTMVKTKTFDEKIDLNNATEIQLQKILGIGPVLSKRVIEYRDRLEGGFADEIELIDVYGLDEELIERIKQEFTVKTPRLISKLNVNEATLDELVTVPYIDYELAYHIIEYRTLHESISAIEELTKIDDFPENKIKLIGLYLQF